MKKLALAAGIIFASSAVLADDYQPAMQEYLETHISTWAQSPVLLDAIRAQNARTGNIAQDEIDQLDLAWRAEVGSGNSEIIAGVLENDAAAFFRDQVEMSGGAISEIFAMDAHGLNVAASGVTSDYWQGDEAKFQETFPAGAGAVHFGEVEFDESSQTYQGQISIVIVDPDSNAPIGAVTVGVNAEALM